MFHFRLSTVLKESFKATATKRPLPGSRRTSCVPARQRCVSAAASVDSRAGLPLLRSPNVALRRLGLFHRGYCAKTEGAAELDEQLKNGGVNEGEK